MKLDSTTETKTRTGFTTKLKRFRFPLPSPVPGANEYPCEVFINLIPPGIHHRMRNVLDIERYSGRLITMTPKTRLKVPAPNNHVGLIAIQFKGSSPAPLANESKLTTRQDHSILGDTAPDGREGKVRSPKLRYLSTSAEQALKTMLPLAADLYLKASLIPRSLDGERPAFWVTGNF